MTDYQELVTNHTIADIIELLSSEQLEINQPDATGKTLLFHAVKANQFDLAKALLDKGADPNVREETMLTPWLFAGSNGLHDLLELMTHYHPKLDDANRFGGTALIPSSEKGFLATVRVAIEAGVPVNQQNSLGWSALQEAAILGNDSYLFAEIIRLLLAHGAKVSLTDFEDKTARDWALVHGHTQIVALLDTPSASEASEQALVDAVYSGQYEAALALINEAPSAEHDFWKGFVYELQADYQTALAIYEAAYLTYKDEQFLFYQAYALRKLQQPSQALAAFDLAIERQPDTFFYLYHKSNYLRELGRHEEAVAAMDQLLAKDPARYDYLFHKANSLRTLGRHEEAVTAMQQARQASPTNPLYPFNQAQSYVLLGKKDEARELLNHILTEGSFPQAVALLDELQ